jgi:RNA polymerase sigma-70 factor, ECF subfamily
MQELCELTILRGNHGLGARARIKPGAGRRIDDSKCTLADALAATAAGDREAFETLYKATSAKLYGIIMRIIGRTDLANDVLQEVYIRVWQCAGLFDPTYGSPMGWLSAIARNRALDQAKRRTPRYLDDCPDAWQIASDDNPLANHERKEKEWRLAACLHRLDPKKKEMVYLAYYFGMTRKEIALKTGRPVATVKTWLRRSLAELKENLGE